jgi:hypothetical protein
MGNNDSSSNIYVSKAAMVVAPHSKGLTPKMICDQIDKSYGTELSKQQFTQQLFSEMDSVPNPQIGYLKVNKTFILERFFKVMIAQVRIQ